MELKTDLYLGDCRKELKKLPDNSVDLIKTCTIQFREKQRNKIPASIDNGFWAEKTRYNRT